MPESSQKKIFFLKSPNANTTAVELFLKKRDFDVRSESDLKIAIREIMTTTPNYVLIAWDHPNDKITHLPRLILQSVMTTIIAYSSSNDKLHIRKLMGSGQPFKLFPPLSGPAIQRLISRLEKEKESNLHFDGGKKQDTEKATSFSSNAVQVKSESQIEDQQNEDLAQFMQSLSDPNQKPSEIYLDKGRRAQELRNLQTLTRHSPVLTGEQSTTEQNKYKIQEQHASELITLKLNQKFDDQVKVPLAEMIETLVESGQNLEFSDFKNETLEKTKHGLCIVIEQPTWCGYLIAASEEGLDPASLETILTNWITENLAPSTDELSQLILNCFVVSLDDVAFETFSEQVSTYTKTIVVNTKKTVVSFFSISSENIFLKLHELHDMFELSINNIPINSNLPFELNIYLPENKKFILYSKNGALLTTLQIERLVEKRVENLYSSIHFENAIQKFRAQEQIRSLIENFKEKQRKRVANA